MTEPSVDRELLDRLNTEWRIAGAPPAGGAPVRRLLYEARRVLGRVLLGPQQAFNSAVVQYLNSIVHLLEQAHAGIEETVRHRESLAARERRIEAALATYQEIRVSIGLLQQATQSLKREVARVSEGGATARSDAGALPPAADALDSYKYVGFEDQFRGSPEDVRGRLAAYAPLFDGAADVIDVGCGRGEFLDLLRERGVSARGVDVNGAMVQVCRDRGLAASEGDALGYLRAQPEASLGGLLAAQVVEHLEPAYLTRFLDAAFDALRPGSAIVLETINAACWYAFFSSYIRDITHVRPLHPDTLRYLLVAAGFQQVEIRYRTPYPDASKLQPVAPRADLADWAAALNGNVEKLNGLLFTWLDYAVIGRRP